MKVSLIFLMGAFGAGIALYLGEGWLPVVGNTLLHMGVAGCLLFITSEFHIPPETGKKEGG